MRSIETKGTFEQIVQAADPQARQIARALRSLIADVYPAVVEVPWLKQHVAGYGVGPKKMSEHFCYIAVQKEYCNLGFYYGAELDDPDGLLEGPGKLLRHIKIRSEADIARPALRALLEEASTHRMPIAG